MIRVMQYVCESLFGEDSREYRFNKRAKKSNQTMKAPQKVKISTKLFSLAWRTDSSSFFFFYPTNAFSIQWQKATWDVIHAGGWEQKCWNIAFD